MTDKNISSPAAETRRDAFHLANELISRADVHILVEGTILKRIEPRLNDEHKQFLESVYRIDHSAVGAKGYTKGTTQAVRWVAGTESNARKVILLTHSVHDYKDLHSEKIRIVTPEEFISKVKNAEELIGKKTISDFMDALMTSFFVP